MAEGWVGVIDRRTGPFSHVRDVDRYPYAFQCPQPLCYLSQAAYTIEEAQQIERTHRCPNLGGTLHISWWSQMTLLEQMWKEMDRVLDEYYLAPAEMKEEKKNYMRGLSYAIALFMQPHLALTDIAGEAVRRRNARLAGDDTYETIGLNARRLEMPPSNRDTAKVTTAAPTKAFTSEELASIKAAAAMIPLSDIARMYGVSEEAIRKAIA